ncbi:hypothetical protein WN944_012873 [Citrus x changshan-huyou]|uniref:Uncharacterized protein n=1 Tax=Citrus x changshan-huyou TaxID=2935761 RepID=A0AAP0QK70_9ROSI
MATEALQWRETSEFRACDGNPLAGNVPATNELRLVIFIDDFESGPVPCAVGLRL